MRGDIRRNWRDNARMSDIAEWVRDPSELRGQVGVRSSFVVAGTAPTPDPAPRSQPTRETPCSTHRLHSAGGRPSARSQDFTTNPNQNT